MSGDFVILFMMEEEGKKWDRTRKEEQRVCIKFRVKSRKTFTETLHLSQTAFAD